MMLFPEMPPNQKTEPSALVRPAETPEVQLLRREAATFLKELRVNVRVYLERRAAIAEEGLATAQADLIESRREYKELPALEHFSALGAALSKQVELDAIRIKKFQVMREQGITHLEALSQAERLIEEGRFAESIPHLRTLREATASTFSSREFLARIQKIADYNGR